MKHLRSYLRNLKIGNGIDMKLIDKFTDLEDFLTPKFQEYDELYESNKHTVPTIKDKFKHTFYFTDLSYINTRGLRPLHIEAFISYVADKLSIMMDWSYSGGRCIIYGNASPDINDEMESLLRELTIRINRIPTKEVEHEISNG